MGFENNIYGNNHPDNTYNLENEDRDRKNLEKENIEKNPNGNQPFVPVEDIPNESPENDIYASVETGLEKDGEDANKFEFDKFGFVQVLQDYFDKVSDDKKEELFQHTNEFLVEYRRILDNAKDEKTALKQANKAFHKIIGEEISGYNAETGKISFDLERAKFIKVRNKKSPIDAVRIKYDRNGRSIDFSKTPVTEKTKETKGIKTKPAKPGLKLPWRR